MKVMLDRELAELYTVETKHLKEQVRKSCFSLLVLFDKKV